MVICHGGNTEIIHRIVNLEEKDNELSFRSAAFKVSYDTNKDIQHSQKKKKKDMNSEELWVECKKEESQE